MEPLTLALIMGGGKAIQGIGQGISSYQQAEGMMSDFEKERMKQLQREQELGMLGFSQGELADMRQGLINPIKAAQREQSDQLKATMAGMDAGAGSTFLTALAANERATEAQAKAEDSIQKMNQMEKQREEQLLMGLNRAAAAQEAAKKAAITQAITLGIGGGIETGTQGMLLGEEMSMGQSELDQNAEYLKAMQAAQGYISGGQ